MPLSGLIRPPGAAAVPPSGRLGCPRCGVAYDARLVEGACPVCAAPALGYRSRRRTVGDQAVLLVGAATIANLVLLAVLAVLLLR